MVVGVALSLILSHLLHSRQHYPYQPWLPSELTHSGMIERGGEEKEEGIEEEWMDRKKATISRPCSRLVFVKIVSY